MSVAAHLGKDAVTSQLRMDTIDQLLKQVREDETNSSPRNIKRRKRVEIKSVRKKPVVDKAVDKTDEVGYRLIFHCWLG